MSPERSALMARVGQRDTKPETVVRGLAHGLGYRFRLHRRDLPGTPDLVFPRLRKVIFVHGCFWHRHPGCRLSSVPKTRHEFWQQKFVQNVERDNRAVGDIQRLGWDVLIVWECETKIKEALQSRLSEWLASEACY
ncbi:DNA mismatch endonuclease Vsr [Mesorhizobium sp. M1D.F.Ca.ET.234.01.1.1]|uniref:very short patch repair endonuclease n=1 Tax=unclassified Mesorhizobium TaxID=325217 RepID=UPI0032AFCCA0